MAQIIQFPTDKEISDILFNPKNKYGLLINGKNRLNGPRWSPVLQYNLNIYDWELLMTGRLDFGDVCPLNRVNENDVTRILTPEYSVRKSLADLITSYETKQYANGCYKEVIKVLSGAEEVLSDFKAGIRRLSEINGADTLTTIIIFSHGEKRGIQMGSSWLPYKRLLEDLDKISGKKVVLVYACHSGYFLRTLRLHSQRKDYAAITSCESNNESTKWNNLELDDYLFRHFSDGAKFSDLELKPINGATHNQHPQMLRYFDVKLI